MSGKHEHTEPIGGFSAETGPTTFSSHQTRNGGLNMDQANVVAFVGHGVEFKGVIKYQGSVRIDGRLDGEVHAEGTLYLGEQAVITAKISAQSVISKGQITGNITAREKVQLLSPAVMNGEVFSPSLLIEEGVQFNGTLEMSKMLSSGQEHQPFKQPQKKESEKIDESLVLA